MVHLVTIISQGTDDDLVLDYTKMITDKREVPGGLLTQP